MCCLRIPVICKFWNLNAVRIEDELKPFCYILSEQNSVTEVWIQLDTNFETSVKFKSV